MDLHTIQLIVGISVGVTTVLGFVFGWFEKLRVRLVGSRTGRGVLAIPKKTMILQPAPRPNSLWWHMGSLDGKPVMQIVGDLNLTNITAFNIVLNGARLKKPKVFGNAFVREDGSKFYGPNYPIPAYAVTELRFDFFVQPPVGAVGAIFKADIAIVDNFGNQHWLKELEFNYA